MKIVILGYMASGKTFIANKLSDKLVMKHIDLDAYIEEKENKKITKIFSIKGEIYFRRIENMYLKELLLLKEDFILSVGGGTPCYGNNMDLIVKHSVSVYLKASLQTIYSRLKEGKEQRPLVMMLNNVDLKEFIAKHLFERSSFYFKANEVINVDSQSLTEIISEIKLKLHL